MAPRATLASSSPPPPSAGGAPGLLLRCFLHSLLLMWAPVGEALPGSSPSSLEETPTSSIHPPMGWNSYNTIGCSITEWVVRDTVDALVSSGLAQLGYKYVNIDDCWHNMSRDSQGVLQPTSWGFPSGIKALSDYAHSKGLKLGIYTDAGVKTCAGRPGSLNFETVDAQTFADWGIDFVKVDNCYKGKESNLVRFRRMGQALRSTGRPMIYSVCNWGEDNPAEWAKTSASADMWRTYGDLNKTWHDTLKAAWVNNVWADYAGPGAWNDPDMLQVGNGGLTESEERVQFALWAIMKAPLLLSFDIRKMTPRVKALVGHYPLIAINQDSLGVQARKVQWDVSSEVWAGPLSGGRHVVALLNRAGVPLTVSIHLAQTLGLHWAALPYTLVDVWQKSYRVANSPVVSELVPPHDIAVFIVGPVEGRPGVLLSSP